MQSMQVGKPFELCEFEITPFPATITGEMKTSVYEVGGDEPTGIIRTDQDWYVLVEFILKGPLMHHFCGEFLGDLGAPLPDDALNGGQDIVL